MLNFTHKREKSSLKSLYVNGMRCAAVASRHRKDDESVETRILILSKM